nr:platelet endothelial aggregation receptor 1-like isoform X2 [Crassostrea virginica]
MRRRKTRGEMAALYLLNLFAAITVAYENLALNKPAFQKNPYSGRKASDAVDGFQLNLSDYGDHCIISGERKETATWWVNLTSILSIHHIMIYYMTGRTEWGPSNEFTRGFLGFSIYISNTTNKNDGILCFKDTNYTASNIPEVFTTNCPYHGQYVIYYNERLPRVPYPREYSKFAYNDLCEVEVKGCKLSGYYGVNCSTPCPDPNCRYCHIETGACQGCKPGYRGHQCELECPYGKYGDGCRNICGMCEDLRHCHFLTGTCLSGCEPGYLGEDCNKECNQGEYGNNCTAICGHCYNSLCHHVNGSCLSGCNPGYQGTMCKQVCDFGYYGTRCEHQCSIFCKDSRRCNPVSGVCEEGCKLGWHGKYCLQLYTDTNLYLTITGVSGIWIVLIPVIMYICAFFRRKIKTKKHVEGESLPLQNR